MARRPRVDRELERYLVDGETVIVAVRLHWFHLARDILIALGGFGQAGIEDGEFILEGALEIGILDPSGDKVLRALHA